MKLKIVLIGCFLLIVVTWGLSSVWGQTTTPGLDGKMRAAYWGIKGRDEAAAQSGHLRAQGLNTALIKDGRFQIYKELWQAWGDAAQAQQIALMPVLNFGGPEERKALAGQYLPYTDRAGNVLPATPCPLDSAYWAAALRARFAELAQLSITTALAGLVFDTEMYGSEIGIYRDNCFCDACWKKSLPPGPSPKERGDALPFGEGRGGVSPAERFAYLAEHQLVEQYTAFQIAQLAGMLAELETYLHRINPNLSFGFLAYLDSWFYEGLIRGLGTPTRPVLVFPENSYITGYSAAIRHTEQRITGGDRSANPTARYIPGLWLGRFFPEDLPSQLYNLAIHTDGYWLFTADSLWNPFPKPEPYGLHGSQDEYWAALQMVNAELDAFEQASQTYQSSLSPVPESSWYDENQQRLWTPPTLTALLQRMAERQTAWPSASVKSRGTLLMHCLNIGSSAAQTGTITLRPVQVGQYHDNASYTVFDADGRRGQEAQFTSQDRALNVPLPAEAGGLFSLRVTSGANAVQVTFAGLPCLLEASPTFPLATYLDAQTYRFPWQAAQPRHTLRAYCSDGETAVLTIQSPDQRILAESAIAGWTEMEFAATDTLADTHQEQWGYVVVRPVPSQTFEDLRWYFYNAALPYLRIR